MWIKIFLFFCMVPVLPIMYLVMRNETKPKKNIILGITLPYEARQDEKVADICRSYRKKLGICTLVLLFAAFVAFVIPSFSIALTYLLIWMEFTIVIPYVIYVSAYQKLKQMKQEQLWYSDLAGFETVDTKAASASFKKMSVGWFIPPLIISLIPIVVVLMGPGKGEMKLWLLFGCFLNALIVVSFVFLSRIIYHQKAEAVDDNSDLTIVLTQVRRYQWSKTWLWAAWLTSFFCLSFLLLEHMILFLGITILYTVLLMFVVIRAEFAARHAQETLTAESGKGIYRDEDDHWIYGQFYYNPNDHHFWVNNRVGTGTSINLGRPFGKIFMGISVLILFLMPLLGGWCMMEEFTPLNAQIVNESLVVTHTGTVFKTEINDIQSIELLETLPRYHKIVGSGMENLLKGKFRITGWYECRLYLNPQKKPFLKLVLNDESIVIVGSSDGNIENIYRQLLSEVKQE